MGNKTHITDSIRKEYKDLGDGSFAETISLNNEEFRNDSFGRLRTSSLHTIFDSTLQYGKMGLLWGSLYQDQLPLHIYPMKVVY